MLRDCDCAYLFAIASYRDCTPYRLICPWRASLSTSKCQFEVQLFALFKLIDHKESTNLSKFDATLADFLRSGNEVVDVLV